MKKRAKHFRGVQGRKTDMIDSKWLADLLRLRIAEEQFHSAAREIRELRDLTRWRVHSLGASGMRPGWPPGASAGWKKREQLKLALEGSTTDHRDSRASR